jgi:CBS domain-containing protein
LAQNTNSNDDAPRFGQVIGCVLIGFGVFVALVRADFFTGFWTVLVGLFLFDSAKGIIRQVKQSEKLLVEDVMSLPVVVKPETDVLHFVDHTLPLYRHKIFPVAKDGQLYGILTLEDLKKLPRDDWHKTQIQTMMRPVTPDYFVETDTSLLEAKELMRANGIGALGVLDAKGNLVGFLQGNKFK